MTDKKEKVMDHLNKKTEVFNLEKVNDGNEINHLNLKTQHPFEVMLYVNHFKSSEINVGVDGGVVIVTGYHEARTDEHGFICRKFSRKYNLPEDLKPEHLLAIFSEDGIFTIQAYQEKEYKKHDEENSDEPRKSFETKQFKDGQKFSQKNEALKADEVKSSGGVPQLVEKKQSIEDQETEPVKEKPCVKDLALKTVKSKQTATAGQAEKKTPAAVSSPKLDEVKKVPGAVKGRKSVVAKQTSASDFPSKSVVAKQTPALALSSKPVQRKQTPASRLSPKSIQAKQIPASGVFSKSVQGKQTAAAGQAEVKSLATVKSPKLVDVNKASGLVKDPKSEVKKPVGECQASKPGEARVCKMQASKSDDGKPTSRGQAAKSRRKSDAKSPKSAARSEERWKT